MALNILLLVDDPLVGSSLEQLVSSDKRFVLAASYPLANFKELDINLLEVDAVLADLGWNSVMTPEILSNLSSIQKILVLYPSAISGEDARLKRFTGAIQRTSKGTQILAALEAIAVGFEVREPINNSSLIPVDEVQLTMQAVEPLTARENDVLACLMEGLPNKLIALRLGISEHTAKFHVTSILSKLGAQSRTEAVIKAARMGLIRM